MLRAPCGGLYKALVSQVPVWLPLACAPYYPCQPPVWARVALCISQCESDGEDTQNCDNQLDMILR